MRKLNTLIAFFLVISLNAQFKKLPTTSGSAEPINYIEPINFNVSSNKNTEDFKINMLSKSHLAELKMKDFKVLARGKNGLPLAIEGSFKDENRDISIESRAYSHLDKLSSLLQIKDASNEFKVVSTDTDILGNQHVKMQQQWNGINVFASEIIVHTQDNRIDFVNGRYQIKPENLETTPKFTVSQSTSIVAKSLGNILSEEDFDSKIFNINPNKVELVYYNHEGKIKLAYHHIVFKNLIERYEYFIDAQTGEVLNQYESMCKLHNHAKGQICSSNLIENKNEVSNAEVSVVMDGVATANALDLFNISRTINTYQVGSKFYLIDGSRPMFKPTSVMPNDPQGSIWTIDAFNTSPAKNSFKYDHVISNNNTWSSKTSVSAHYNGGRAYEYFKNTHSRNSINGSGGNIISIINVADEDGTSMGNAFWNGAAIFYGNGDNFFEPLAKGLDVAGHEMSHGVVQNTANLVYQGESGALNESFADIFGAMIDRDDWLIGEDVAKKPAFPSGALRSMQDPHNGAPTGNYNAGWQPKLYSERFTGTQDNGGVHINSGIPNHAFYLFANNPSVGRDKAELVYYRALSNYLTKSSQFVDARIAVVRAAKELYGDAIANIATQAFDQVQIPGGNGTNNQTDVDTNPGVDLILFTDGNKNNLYLFTADGQEVANPLSNKKVQSRPSITDDGSIIVFVGGDKKINYIQIDWAKGTVAEGVLNTGSVTWRNVAISKDGSKLAALRSNLDNKMTIINLEDGKFNEYELKNPTFSEGVSTGDVIAADAMEWDFTGEYVMYDAENSIKSTTAGEINYWDIGFIKVWNNKAKSFALPDQIEKLFPALEEGESIGNPTFSKNSPYIIAFDYIFEQGGNSDYNILGVNLETNKLGLIAPNNTIGFPSYSTKDNKVIYESSGFLDNELNIINLDNTKIKGNQQTVQEYTTDARYGVWFSNGKRVISSIKKEPLDKNILNLTPNPANNEITLNFTSNSSSDFDVVISDVTGRMVLSSKEKVFVGQNQINLNISNLKEGIYFITLKDEQTSSISKAFIKK